MFIVYILLEICMKFIHTKRMFSFEKFQDVFMQNLVPKRVHLLEVNFMIIQTAQYGRVTLCKLVTVHVPCKYQLK